MLFGWAAVISAIASVLSSFGLMLPLLLKMRSEAKRNTAAVTTAVDANTTAIEVVHNVVNQNHKDVEAQTTRLNAALTDAGIPLPIDPTLAE